jgi:uncharacterized protein (TIGR03790 family)
MWCKRKIDDAGDQEHADAKANAQVWYRRFTSCGNRAHRTDVLAALALVASIAFAGPARALDPTQLAVIINTSDPLSIQIGDYYAARRRIPLQNVIRISFPPGRTGLYESEFDAIKATVDRQTPANVQAYALTWAAPYRVACMSITAAFAFGFDRAFCAEGCKPTRVSPYFNSAATQPFTELKIRPTMSLAALSFDEAKALIDRGIAADSTRPPGTAYLVSTSETARNVRSRWYGLVQRMFGKRLRVVEVHDDALWNRDDVLFYFTGKREVDGLSTLRFLPGAIADHLTSSAGMLTDSGQMSALRWLEAGATASYGTVEEPCNFLEKFPHPAVVIGHYLEGDTAIEAYWKSVNMPGQGIFIGEPLAAPFRNTRKW